MSSFAPTMTMTPLTPISTPASAPRLLECPPAPPGRCAQLCASSSASSVSEFLPLEPPPHYRGDSIRTRERGMLDQSPSKKTNTTHPYFLSTPVSTPAENNGIFLVFPTESYNCRSRFILPRRRLPSRPNATAPTGTAQQQQEDQERSWPPALLSSMPLLELPRPRPLRASPISTDVASSFTPTQRQEERPTFGLSRDNLVRYTDANRGFNTLKKRRAVSIDSTSSFTDFETPESKQLRR